MKTKINFLLLLLGMAIISSCSSETTEEVVTSTNDTKKIEVVNLGTFIKQSSTRSFSNSLLGLKPIDETQDVLKFETFNDAVLTIKELSDKKDVEKKQFYKSLKFYGAYDLLDTAETEIDKILDLDNENELRTAIKAYKEKYKNVILFNSEDEYDVTPSLTFENDVRKLVASKQGYIIIGNELKNVEDINLNQNMTRAFGPIIINPTFVPIPGAGSAVIKRKKYRSDISVGMERSSRELMYRAASQKKTLFWSTRYVTEYKCDLYVDGKKWIVNDPNRGRVEVRTVILTPPLNTSVFIGKKIKGSIKNFTSGCCSGVYGSHEFTLDFTKM